MSPSMQHILHSAMSHCANLTFQFASLTLTYTYIHTYHPDTADCTLQ